MGKLSARVFDLMGPTGMALASWSCWSAHAHAFGGLWPSQAQPAQQTAQQVLFVDPPGPSLTSVIRLQTGGPTQELAWLVPVPGKPSVALSSNAVFERLDAVTAPQYWVEIGIEGSCSQPEPLVPAYDPDYEPGAVGGTGGGKPTLVDQGSLGALDYATLQLDPAASDPVQAAIDWLAQNGYRTRGAERELLGPYLRQGYNLLAFKVKSGADPRWLRPVALTYEGEQPVLPIRAASAAAASDLGVVVWVIGPAQAVPANFASLVLNDALIDWLSGRKFAANTLPAGGAGPFGPPVPKPRNYDALVASAVDEAGGRGFVTELGQPASRYRELVWSAHDRDNLEQLSAQTFDDGLDLVLMAHGHFGTWDGFRDAVSAAITLPQGVSLETFGANPEQYRGAVKVDSARFLQLLEEKVTRPVADAAALMHQGPYLTRLFSVTRGAPTLDPRFDYNPDLGQIHNVHVAQQRLQCGEGAPAQRDAGWQLTLPQGALIQGHGGEAWPLALGALPANLKVVTLSTQGSGEVVTDNSQRIGDGLRGAGHGSVTHTSPTSPQHGESIGGPQSVVPEADLPVAESDAGEPGGEDGNADDDPARAARHDGCDVSRGRARDATPAWLFASTLLGLVLRRRPLRGVR